MKRQLLYLGIALTLTLSLYVVFDLPLGYTALAVFVGWPVVGTIVTADDDLPGGWSNPDGSMPLPWTTAWFWGLLSLRFSIAMVAFMIEAAFRKSEAAVFLVLAALSGMVAFVLLKRSSSDASAKSS